MLDCKNYFKKQIFQYFTSVYCLFNKLSRWIETELMSTIYLLLEGNSAVQNKNKDPSKL